MRVPGYVEVLWSPGARTCGCAHVLRPCPPSLCECEQAPDDGVGDGMSTASIQNHMVNDIQDGTRNETFSDHVNTRGVASNTRRVADDLDQDLDDRRATTTATKEKHKTMKAQKWKGTNLSFLNVNCKRLMMGKTKVVELQELLRTMHWPGIVCLTETSGITGKTDFRARLGMDINRRYKVQWTMRPLMNKDGEARSSQGVVGGGVAILVNRRLHLDIQVVHVPVPQEEEQYLDGHFRVWRLDPEQPRPGTEKKAHPFAIHRPMMITTVYAPPADQDGWGRQSRKIIFDAIQTSDQMIQELRQVEDVFAMTMEHLNAADGGVDVPLIYDKTVWTVAKLQAALATVPRKLSTQRGRLVLHNGDELKVQRCKSRNAPLLTMKQKQGQVGQRLQACMKEGVAITLAAAMTGKIPLAGVMGHRQSTSWTACKHCKVAEKKRASCRANEKKAAAKRATPSKQGRKNQGKKNTGQPMAREKSNSNGPQFTTGSTNTENQVSACGKKNCGRMRSCIDQVRVPADLVLRALLCPLGGKRYLRYYTRRIWWSKTIDHAVTWGSMFIAPMAPHADPTESDTESDSGGAAPRRQMRRRTFPTNLLERRRDLQAIRDRARRHFENNQRPSGNNIDALEAYLLDGLRNSTGETMSLPNDGDAETEVASNSVQKRLAVALGESRAAQRGLSQAFHDKYDPHNPASLEQKQEAVRRAGRTLRKACAQMEKLKAQQRAEAVAAGRLRAPKEAWSLMFEGAKDHGAPPAPIFLVGTKQNNKKGQFVTNQPKQCRRNCYKQRRMVHQIRAELGDGCEQYLTQAMVEVGAFNSKLRTTYPSIRPDSAVATTDTLALECWANDPTLATMPQRPLPSAMPDQEPPTLQEPPLPAIQTMRDFDTRRGYVRNLHDELQRARVRRHPEETRGELVRRTFPKACADLERDLELSEVTAVFALRLKDVGCGTDGLSVVVLRLQQEGIVPAEVLHLLQLVWDTGCMPSAWRCHRSVLCYKGHGSDPYCLDNYRGLGIDQALLKVLSYVMLERLNTFLTITGGLTSAQNGFQRQKGCAEAIFTLSETVRAATSRRMAHLVFIDIERAYDSVLHPILWKKCIDKGMGGRFLSTLQALYHGALIVLDMGGELARDLIPIECGILQGNPLSPALFNIYIDDAIRSLDGLHVQDGPCFGLPLPQVRGRGDSQPVRQPIAFEQRDFLTSLFFADDGVLMDFNLERLQLMLNRIQEQLALLGLLLNVSKTKHLIVAQHALRGHDASAALVNDEYKKLKEATLQSPLMVGTRPIGLVDRFEYLGAWVSWRWNWEAAWRMALRLASREVYAMRKGGLQCLGISLASQVDYVRGKVACHFNYIAAVAGAGGAVSSAPWRPAEKKMVDALRTVIGYRFANATALMAESGTWDQQTRIDMLLLRFWCKVLTLDPCSTTYRAMCLSVQSMTPYQRTQPTVADHNIDQIHRQPWAQQLWAAAQRFNMPPPDPTRLWHGLTLVQADRNGSGTFENVPFCMDATEAAALGTPIPDGTRLRLALPGLEPDDYREGVNCWQLGDDARVARLSTPGPRRCFAALKQRGNACRQAILRDTVQDTLKKHDKESGLRRWASITSASYLQPYWHLPNVEAARRMVQVRLDCAPTEDYMRRRTSAQNGKAIRLPDRVTRACYCCGAIMDVAGVFHPDTLEHVLLHCKRDEAVSRRDSFRMHLDAWSMETETRAAAGDVAPPTLTMSASASRDAADTALLTVLRLCTGQGIAATPERPGGVAALRPLRHSANADTLASRARTLRALPEFTYDADAATSAMRWVDILLAGWMASVRALDADTWPSNTPGCRLATMVAEHVQQVFRDRRTFLKENSDYKSRARDPGEG